MLNTSYAYIVNNLYNKMKTLLGDYRAFDPAVVNTDSGKALFEKIKKIHNKLAFMSLTGDKRLLAVTGEQGSGKSTLVNYLYELEEGYLPENEGRGEQIPVVITEKKGITEPECFVVELKKADDKFDLVKREIRKEECHQIALHPEFEIWLELNVPYRFMNNESSSIVLLPGFETDKGHLSQQLLDHILYMSTSSVVVFSKDTFARESAANVIRKVKKTFKDVLPIYVISHGDVNQDQNDEIKQQVIEEFEISPEQVIISGDPKDYEEPWKEELINAINQFGYVNDEIDMKKVDMLMGMADDLSDVMSEIKTILEQYHEKSLITTIGGGMKDRKLLTDFRTTYEKHLKEMRQAIINSLSQRKDQAKKDFDQYVMDHVNVWNNIKSFFVSSELEEAIKFENKIEEVWEQAIEVSPNEEMVTVLSNCIDGLEKSVEISAERAKAISTSQKRLEQGDTNDLLPVSVPKAEGELSVTVQESLGTINRFFAANQENQLVTLGTAELQTMVLIGTMLGKQSFIGSELIEVAAQVDQNRAQVRADNLEKLNEQIAKSNQEIENMQRKLDIASKKTNMILKGIPVILGVDVAMDGQFDLLTGASAALAKIGIAISPAALLSIIGVGLVGVKAVEIIHKQALINNERKIKMATAGRKIIDSLPELQADAYCGVLRNIYEKMEERIREQHEWKRAALGYEQDYLKLEYLVNSIQKNTKELIKEVMKNDRTFVHA